MSERNSNQETDRAQFELLATCPGFIRGALRLESYPWAEAIFHDLDRRGAAVAVKACNGAGKTERVAAPVALWHASVFPKSLTIATAGVFRQVKEQLFPAIRSHAHKFRGWTFNECEVITHNGSRILGFSTDEPGKFEGWHADNLLVVADEAKSIPDSIFEAVERCQPTRLLLLSSPGGRSGFFYSAFNERRKFFRQHTVTAADCPHISPAWVTEQIEKYGPDHPLVRSMIYAEFMDLGGDSAVIPLTFVERCLQTPPQFSDTGEVQAFCDFAAGGDENVLAVRRGNRVELVACWREPDTMKAVGQFIIHSKAQKLEAHQIMGDEGGLGIAVCDRLAESGWDIVRVNNGSPASKPDAYTNLAAETWFEGRTLIEKQQVILPNDPALIAQLTSRLGWPDSRGRLQLEPKSALRARGLPSPDRADAVLGCMWQPWIGGAIRNASELMGGSSDTDARPWGWVGDDRLNDSDF
jgi:hypothetical protein